MSPIRNLTPVDVRLKRATAVSFGESQATQTDDIMPILGGAIGGLIGLAVLGYCVICLWIKRMAGSANAQARGLRGWIKGLGSASAPRTEGSVGSDTVCSGGGKGVFDALPSPRLERDSMVSAPIPMFTPPPSARSATTPEPSPPVTPSTPTMTTNPDVASHGFGQGRARVPGYSDGPESAVFPPQTRLSVPDVASSAPGPLIPPPPSEAKVTHPRIAGPAIIRPMSDRRVSWMTDLTNSTVPEEKKVKKQKAARLALRSYQQEASRSFLDV